MMKVLRKAIEMETQSLFRDDAQNDGSFKKMMLRQRHDVNDN